MSDSDETVCGNESEEENTENSPSILSNWRKDEAVFSTQKDEKSPEKNTGKERHKENRGILNGDGMVPSPETEISPEFPLITRGLKRKEDFDETEKATLNAKDVQSETNSTQIADETSSTESENIPNTSITHSRTTDDDKRLEKLKTVEDLLKELELTSERDGNVCNLGYLQNAKSQLADIQKLLIESNHKNQAKRKMILSDAENTQQLSQEKKLAIVNLAKKQRILLEAFKKYKNLVQKLKAMKDLNTASQRSDELSVSSVEMPTQTTQNQSTTTSKSGVSIPSSKSGQPPNNLIQCSSQNSQNLSISTSQGKESIPSSTHHPDRSVLSNNSRNLSTTSKASESSTMSKVVITNAANPGLTKAIQQGSVQFIILQNQSNNSSQILSQSQPSQPNSLSRVSTVSGSRRSTVTQNAPQSVLTQHTSTTKATFLAGPNNTIASKQPGTPNMMMKQSLPPIHTTVSTAASQSSKAPATYVNVSSMIQRNQQSSMLRPTAMNQTLIPSNRPSNQASPAKTFSQTVATSPHLPAPSQSQPLTIGLSASQSQTIGVPTTSFLRSRVNQTTIRPSITANPELSLETLVKKGILAPGKNVLTTASEGKLYSASLSDKGTIISAGGEGFTSPRSWLKAISGSKRKVRNELAWKMVSYKNKPLLDQACPLTPEPTKATETSVNLNLEARQAPGPIQSKISRELINTTQALKALLSNCRIIGINKEEVLSLEQGQKSFWDNVDMELLNDDISKALDF